MTATPMQRNAHGGHGQERPLLETQPNACPLVQTQWQAQTQQNAHARHTTGTQQNADGVSATQRDVADTTRRKTTQGRLQLSWWKNAEMGLLCHLRRRERWITVQAPGASARLHPNS